MFISFFLKYPGRVRFWPYWNKTDCANKNSRPARTALLRFRSRLRNTLALAIAVAAPLAFSASGFAADLGGGAHFNDDQTETNIPWYPAYLGFYEHPVAAGRYSLSDTAEHSGATTSIPLAFGSIGFDYENVIADSLEYQLMHAALAKRLTPHFSIGLQGGLASSQPGEAYYGGVSFVHRNDELHYNGRRLALHGLAFGLSVFALTPFSDFEPASALGGLGAIDVTVYRNRDIAFHLVNEAALRYGASYADAAFDTSHMALLAYEQFYFKAGLASLEKLQVLAGAGFRPSWGETRLFLEYQITGGSSGDSLTHYLTAGGYFSMLDTLPPEVTVTLNRNAISPNSDGEMDEVTFKIKVKEANPIANWVFTIENEKGEIVRTFRKDFRKKKIEYSVSRIPSDLIKRVENLYIPDRLVWNGTYDPADPAEVKEEIESRVVPDGSYRYSLTVTDRSGNHSKQTEGVILVDSRRPVVHVEATASYLVVPEKGRIPYLTIYQSFYEESPDDTVEVVIVNEAGNVVQRFTWPARQATSRYRWEPVLPNGDPLPEGLYKYRATISDLAGNSSSQETQWIAIYRDNKVADLELEKSGFSPNGDGQFDTIVFKPQLSSRSRLSDWRIYVYAPLKNDNEIELIRTWEPEETDRVSAPGPIEWDGETDSGEELSGGVYYIAFEAEYTNKKTISAFPRPFSIDLETPDISVKNRQDVFSPDGDDRDEETFFHISVRDQSDITLCKLIVNEVFYFADQTERRPYRTWETPGLCKEKIRWQGIDDKGYLPESDSVFEYHLEAIDEYGNVARSKTEIIRTDLLVYNKKEFLILRLSSASYENGSIEPTRRAMRKVDRVLKRLKKYPRYLVRVEGHTDDRGDEEKNLSLSEERAQYIIDYFIQKGFPENEVGYQGLGEIKPVWEKEDDYARSVNERIDFILIEKD